MAISMVVAQKERLREMQQIIARMPLDMCCSMVVQEFGVNWRAVSQAIRNNRLRMSPDSVAKVLARHSRTLPVEEVECIINRLRLKLLVIQKRQWHVIDLMDPIDEDSSIDDLVHRLPGRISHAMRQTRKGNIQPEVQTLLISDYLYMSVRPVSACGRGCTLYVVTPPGQQVALVSSINNSLVSAAVFGLGYRHHEYAKLYGSDIPSLLQIHNKKWTANADHLHELPKYDPIPVITSNGIDYTNKSYNLNYADSLLGPNPPLLTDVKIEFPKPFYDPSKINKLMNIEVKIKSEDVAKTFKNWVGKGALHPTSELFMIFTKVKGNNLVMNDEE